LFYDKFKECFETAQDELLSKNRELSSRIRGLEHSSTNCTGESSQADENQETAENHQRDSRKHHFWLEQVNENQSKAVGNALATQ
jgi:hypothetical protein